MNTRGHIERELCRGLESLTNSHAAAHAKCDCSEASATAFPNGNDCLSVMTRLNDAIKTAVNNNLAGRVEFRWGLPAVSAEPATRERFTSYFI